MNLRKFFAAAFAAAAMAGCGAVAAQAASLPNIHIRPSGAENQYLVSLQNVESTAHGVQFDITVESGSEVEVQWADQNKNVEQEAVQKVEGDKTTITFYVSKAYPLSNSTQVEIAAITTETEQQAASFHTSGQVKTVDDRQRPTQYSNVSLTFQGEGGETQPPQDPETPGSSNSSSNRDEAGKETSQSAPLLFWDKLSAKVKTENGKKTLSLTAKSGQRLDSEIFRQALAQAIEVTVNYGDYQWVFNGAQGGSVPQKQKYYDLTVEFMSQRNLSAAAQNSDVLQFSVAHSGALPCTGELKVSVGSQYQGQTLYLAQYDQFQGTLEKHSETQVQPDGTASFAIEQGSKYVAVTEDLWAVSAPSGAAGSQTAVVTVPPQATQEEQETQEEAQPQAEQEPQPQQPETEAADAPAKVVPQEEKGFSTAGVFIAVCCIAAFGGAVAFFTIKGKTPSRKK